MKRTKKVQSTRFKKSSSLYQPKPLLGVLLGGALLSGCSDNETGFMYYSEADCIDDNPGSIGVCQAAYQNALDEAAATAPKYTEMASCEIDFGIGNCTDTPLDYRPLGIAMPMMAGFLLTRAMLDDDDFDIDFKKKKKKPKPFFTSYNSRSPFAGRLVSSTGMDYGRAGSRKAKVPSSIFSTKPKAAKTMSRGGFGRTVAKARASSRSGG